VHKMPDFAFYTDVYRGSDISAAAFPRLIQRARDWLEGLEYICRVVPYGPQSRKMALCAAAEVLQRQRNAGYSRTSIGGVSVTYEKNPVPLQRQLVQAVSGYLEIYRGVSVP